MTPLNDELIDEVLARIEEDPDAWDQAEVFGVRQSDIDICGTTACFAVHALLESVWTVELRSEGTHGPYVIVRNPQDQTDHHYETEAAKLLGFTNYEANRVFYATQNVGVAGLRAVIDRIRAERAELQES